MKIKVERVNPEAVIPKFAHDTDSGFDFFTSEDVTIESAEKAILPTGLKFELPFGWGVQIKNKSGITVKGSPIKEITVSNDSCTEKIERADVTVYEGTIDMMYRGEIGIMVKNEEPFPITIPKHTKIAQGLLRQVYSCEFEEVTSVDTNTDRGEGGYGKSGSNLKETK